MKIPLANSNIPVKSPAVIMKNKRRKKPRECRTISRFSAKEYYY